MVRQCVFTLYLSNYYVRLMKADFLNRIPSILGANSSFLFAVQLYCIHTRPLGSVYTFYVPLVMFVFVCLRVQV